MDPESGILIGPRYMAYTKKEAHRRDSTRILQGPRPKDHGKTLGLDRICQNDLSRILFVAGIHASTTNRSLEDVVKPAKPQ